VCDTIGLMSASTPAPSSSTLTHAPSNSTSVSPASRPNSTGSPLTSPSTSAALISTASPSPAPHDTPSRELTSAASYTRNECPHTATQNLAVTEGFFDGITEVLCGSEYTDVGSDVVVDGADAELASVEGTNTERNEWAHEVTLFHAVYDGTLRAIDEAKGMWRDVDLAKETGRLGREKAGWKGSS
jgi:hypothetical protein